ncbi:MAG: hypothetical protein VX913_02885 [Planctomycetota bacterium]|nr:hypothetical protein [Planctomycetota bacterium]
MATLNAENDVFGLVVRYHEARSRAAEYAPLVTDEENRASKLEAQLAALRPRVDAAEFSLAEATKRKSDAEDAAAAATAATAASAAKVAETTAAIAAKDAEFKELEALQGGLDEAIAAAQAKAAGSVAEQSALTAEEARLGQRLNALRDRVALLKSGHRGLAKKLDDIEKQIEALIGKKDG